MCLSSGNNRIINIRCPSTGSFRRIVGYPLQEPTDRKLLHVSVLCAALGVSGCTWWPAERSQQDPSWLAQAAWAWLMLPASTSLAHIVNLIHGGSDVLCDITPAMLPAIDIGAETSIVAGLQPKKYNRMSTLCSAAGR